MDVSLQHSEPRPMYGKRRCAAGVCVFLCAIFAGVLTGVQLVGDSPAGFKQCTGSAAWPHEKLACRWKGGSVVDGRCCFTAKYWGLTKAQLRSLRDAFERNTSNTSEWNMYKFTSNVLTEWYRNEDNLGYAMLMNRNHPQRVTTMISHSWQENVLSFFNDVLKSISEDDVVYICTLSNYQGSDEEVRDQLGTNPRRSPFALAVESARETNGYMLVVPNDNIKVDGGLYSRMWCVWELYLASLQGLPLRFARTAPEYFFNVSMGSLKGSCQPKQNIYKGRTEESCNGLQTPGTARCGSDDEVAIRKFILKEPVANLSNQSCAKMSRCDPFVQLAIVALANICQNGVDGKTVVHPCDAYDVVRNCDAVTSLMDNVTDVMEDLCDKGSIFSAMDGNCKLPQPGGWDNDGVKQTLVAWNETGPHCSNQSLAYRPGETLGGVLNLFISRLAVQPQSSP